MANENADRSVQETAQEACPDVLRDQPSLRRNEYVSRRICQMNCY